MANSITQELNAPDVSSTAANPSLAGANSHGTLAAKSAFLPLVGKRAMSAELSPRLERRIQILTDVGERIFFLLLFTIFAINLAPTLMAVPTNSFVLISEGLIVFFTIVRRDARMVTTRPIDWLTALSGTALPLFAKAGGHAVAPLLGAAVMMLGLSISICGKLTLRRSFGLTAANRGLVHSGPYRLVRHPIYAGYILVYVGFLINNPLTWNFALYFLTISLLIVRIKAEEMLLVHDPDYVAFQQRVGYRVMPGVF